MKQDKAIVAMFLSVVLIAASLTGCGSSDGPSVDNDGAYQKVNLSMAVNGTDTQIDSLVANYFAKLVDERSGRL